MPDDLVLVTLQQCVGVSNCTALTVEERDHPWESGDDSVARAKNGGGQIMIKQETESDAHEKTLLMSQYYEV